VASLTDDEYKAIARRAYAVFKQLANVHSVGVGGRERNGRPTGEVVLKVFVSSKKSSAALPPDQMIPPEFEGVPTDVVEAPAPQHDLLHLIPGFRFSDSFSEDTTKYRPVIGGSQIKSAHNIGNGTLGFLAKVSGDDRIMAVSCFHVFFNDAHGPEADLRVGNPHANTSCTECCKGACGRYVASLYNALGDVAIAKLDPNTQWLAEIRCVGAVKGFHNLTIPETSGLTYDLRKYGRTTRLTGGKVQAIGVSGSLGAPGLATRNYTNAVAVKPNPLADAAPARFSAPGDSGAAYVNNSNEIVAIHFSGNPELGKSSTGWGWGSAIGDVVSQFTANNSITLQPATATHLGDVQTTPAAVGVETVGPTQEQLAFAARMESELAQSERGRVLTDLWLRHSHELNNLVNHNRKVATHWHRNGGPALFQKALRAAQESDSPLEIPAYINGQSVDEAAENMMEVFSKYGSDALRSDLEAHRGILPLLAGRSYQEILENLRD
jgi:hypothetical protein